MSQKALKIPRRITSHSSTLPMATPNPRICPQCTHRSRFFQARHFTSSRPRNSVLGEMRKAPLNTKQPSMKAKMAHMDKGQLGNDLGRLPNTIILPALKDYPKGLKMKATLLFGKFKETLVGMSSLLYATKWDVPKDKRTGRSKRHPMEMSDRLSQARAYHKMMNTALASRDLRALQSICASGLYDQCRTLIDQAKERDLPKQDWYLIRYSGVNYPQFLEKWPLNFFLPYSSARVVSDKATAIPFGKQSYLRECIVRIKSVQSVSTRGKSLHTDKFTEYIVLQKLTVDGDEGKWRVWGTVDPSKEELEEILSGKNKGANSNGFAEQFKERMSGMTGMTF